MKLYSFPFHRTLPRSAANDSLNKSFYRNISFAVAILPRDRNIELIGISRGEPACVNDDACPQAALYEGAERMHAEIRGAHDIVAEHLAAVISDPDIVIISPSVHISHAAAHVEIVIGFLAPFQFRLLV